MELSELIITGSYSYRVRTVDGQSLKLCLVDCGLFKTSDKALQTFDRIDGMSVLKACNLDRLERLTLKYYSGDTENVMKMIVDTLKDKLRGCTTITKCTIVYDGLHVLNEVDVSGLEELTIKWGDRTNKTCIIPNRLRYLSKLKRLTLSYLPESILRLSNMPYKYPSLTYLYCDGVSVSLNLLKSTTILSELVVKFTSSLPSYLYTIDTLRSLTLVGVPSDSILNGTWSNLYDLEHLHIRKIDSIPELPDSFRHLTNLHTLTLSNIQLDTLPNYMTQYSDLNYLDISSNNLVDIHHLPSNISTLRANSNQFNDCPQVLLSTDMSIDIVDISCPNLTLSEADILSLLSRCKSLSIKGNHDIDIDTMICNTDYRVLRV